MVECTTCRLQQESGRQQRQTASGSRLPPPYRNPFHQTRMSCCWRARGLCVQSAASAARVQVRAGRGFAKFYRGGRRAQLAQPRSAAERAFLTRNAARLANLQGRCGPTRPSAQPLPASSTCRCRTSSAGGCCVECLGRATLLSTWLATAQAALPVNTPPADPSVLHHLATSFSPRSYTKSYSRKPGWRMLKSQANGDCVFLKDGRQCTVYGARPLQCSTYPWWPELMDDGGCAPAGATAHHVPARWGLRSPPMKQAAPDSSREAPLLLCSSHASCGSCGTAPGFANQKERNSVRCGACVDPLLRLPAPDAASWVAEGRAVCEGIEHEDALPVDARDKAAVLQTATNYFAEQTAAAEEGRRAGRTRRGGG